MRGMRRVAPIKGGTHQKETARRSEMAVKAPILLVMLQSGFIYI
jgi:hypothetical protein